VITLRNDHLSVEVYPEHGFVIGSIVEHSTGMNLLWNPPGADFGSLGDALGPPGPPSIDDFDRGILAGGWFTMIPNAGLPGMRNMWMHGEAARVTWHVAAVGDSHCTCRIRLPYSGLFVERTVVLEDATVRTYTRVANIGREDVAFAPGEHPCFPRRGFAGGRISIRHGSSGLVASHAEPAAASFAEGQSFSWPLAPASGGGTHDASLVPAEPTITHDHLIVDSGDGRVAIERPDGRGAVTLTFDSTTLPSMLIWSHYMPPASPWGGDVFAVEPTAIPGRSFDDLADQNSHTLAPGSSASWWMDLAVTAPVESEL
jgi:galactose mutarotase-like enzyme